MIILKFGGTSVGSVENIKKVAEIVNKAKKPNIVVLSAMSGVTNALQKIADFLKVHSLEEANLEITLLSNKYKGIIQDLYEQNESFYKANSMLTYNNNLMLSYLEKEFTESLEKDILAQGEIVSTNLFQLYMEEIGEDSNLISALDFMKIDSNGEPEMDVIKEQLSKIISNREAKTFITQGFICKNPGGEVDNLKRGGSDYTASIIGAVMDASEIQIWTDIDGMHNNDPRYVDQTFSVEEVSFDEAAELAYFGAKILHPLSIIPARDKNIPVLLKNTFKPEAKGTLIHNKAKCSNVRAIAAKDNITAIKIKSYRMLMAYGFLKKVFEIFEKNQTPIDMITTSEVAVSLTIDNTSRLENITEELKAFGKIEVDSDLSIICIAGDLAQNKKGVTASIFNCLKDVPIRMISYGGSNYNLSFLVKTSDKINVLNLLNKGLFPNLAKQHKKLAV